MAFGMGVCPAKELEAAGVAIGLGVDGSASNDSSNMMEAVRHSLMLQRLSYGPSAVTPYDALRWATEGSARCLGRDDIGAIAPGMQADLALYHARRAALLGRAGPDRGASPLRGPSRRPGDGRGDMAGHRRRARGRRPPRPDRQAQGGGPRLRLNRPRPSALSPDATKARVSERKRKRKKAKWLFFAFFRFLLLFGIGTFQRVMSEKSEKNFPPPSLASQVAGVVASSRDQSRSPSVRRESRERSAGSQK